MGKAARNPIASAYICDQKMVPKEPRCLPAPGSLLDPGMRGVLDVRGDTRRTNVLVG
jgi:hypothetical protein